MASGRLGTASLVAATNTVIYTAPTGKSPTLTVNFCNTGATAIPIRLAIAQADTPVAGEWIEYGVSLPANGVLERAGIVLSEGQKVVAYAGASGVDVNVWGFEE